MRSDELKHVVANGHARIWGDVVVVDQREPRAPLDAQVLSEREPNPLEWYLYGGIEPMRRAEPAPDPWLTWEWRTHLDQPTTAPAGGDEAHASLDELRVRHNVAVATGDEAHARALRQRIDAELDRSVRARFEPGVTLVGVRRSGRAQSRLDVWFEADGPAAGDLTFTVHSAVEKRSPTSLIPPDPVERDMAYPPSIPTKLWRPGFLYTVPVVLRHRVGQERYFGWFTSRDGSPAPRRPDGKMQTDLLVER
jgi:hypothetical protein